MTGTIVENLPGTQTSFQWQVGKTLTGMVNLGSDYKVRVTAVVPPAASGTTYYFYDSGGKLLAEYDGTGVCVKDYLYLGGKMIGEFVPATSSYYYYASDQINSTRLVTDSTGAVVHSAQYDPYGGLYKTWVDTYHPKPGFSGKEREFGSEMDYFGARYFGHKQYRFLSVDPVIGREEALECPQLWNFYAYCRNNPVTYLDPDGMDTIVVIYGEPGIVGAQSRRNHDVGRQFQLSAQTRLNELKEQYAGKNGINYVFNEVASIRDINAALDHQDLILVEYFGHGTASSLIPGENPGKNTNFLTNDAASARGKFLEGGQITLHSCHSGASPNGIAQAFADRFGVKVQGSKNGQIFQNDGKNWRMVDEKGSPMQTFYQDPNY